MVNSKTTPALAPPPMAAAGPDPRGRKGSAKVYVRRVVTGRIRSMPMPRPNHHTASSRYLPDRGEKPPLTREDFLDLTMKVLAGTDPHAAPLPLFTFPGTSLAILFMAA
jgi:hypothetical protein